MTAPPAVRTGVDVLELERFRRALERHPGLRQRVFLAGELERCDARRDPVPCLAVRFAAKEAVGKVLGTGILGWRDIEVVGGEPPTVRLHGRTAEAARAQGLGEVSVSLSHSRSWAVAVAAALVPGAGKGGGEAHA